MGCSCKGSFLEVSCDSPLWDVLKEFILCLGQLASLLNTCFKVLMGKMSPEWRHFG